MRWDVSGWQLIQRTVKPLNNLANRTMAWLVSVIQITELLQLTRPKMWSLKPFLLGFSSSQFVFKLELERFCSGLSIRLISSLPDIQVSLAKLKRRLTPFV